VIEKDILERRSREEYSNMIQTFSLFGAIRQTLGRSLRNGFFGFLIGAGLVEALAGLLNKSNVSSVQNLIAAPQYTLFVHVVAALFAVTLATLCMVWTAAVRTVQGLLKGADEVVDAVDGPNRHGLF
jgi:hypothetical protein